MKREKQQTLIEKIIKEFEEKISIDGELRYSTMVEPRLCDAEKTKKWLESEMKSFIKEAIPQKKSDKTTEYEIRNFPRRLDDEGKQKIRAKNWGWNLCVEEMKNRYKQ